MEEWEALGWELGVARGGTVGIAAITAPCRAGTIPPAAAAVARRASCTCAPGRTLGAGHGTTAGHRPPGSGQRCAVRTPHRGRGGHEGWGAAQLLAGQGLGWSGSPWGGVRLQCVRRAHTAAQHQEALSRPPPAVHRRRCKAGAGASHAPAGEGQQHCGQSSGGRAGASAFPRGARARPGVPQIPS